MKKIISRIALVLAGICLTLNAIAQSNDNPRRIWLVAHACNCHRWLQTALQDGANGVEIDVNCPLKIDPTATYVDFSVFHGYKGRYAPPEYRAKQNKGKDPLDYYVSLQEYLNFEEMDNISILWLDAKCEEPGQVYHLVKEVHRILIDRYGSKEAIPFSIIYGLYKMHTLKDVIGNAYSIKYSGTPLIDWLRDNLWENEGTGLASEGRYGSCWTSETLDQLNDFFKNHQFPIGKHFSSVGTGGPFPIRFTNDMVKSLDTLKNWRDQGKYCARTGTWTMGLEEYALLMIPSKEAYPKSKGTECDLILVEAQNDCLPPKRFKAWYDNYAVQKFVRRFFRPSSADSYYYKYNRGQYVLAGNRWEDPFYK